MLAEGIRLYNTFHMLTVASNERRADLVWQECAEEKIKMITISSKTYEHRDNTRRQPEIRRTERSVHRASNCKSSGCPRAARRTQRNARGVSPRPSFIMQAVDDGTDISLTKQPAVRVWHSRPRPPCV